MESQEGEKELISVYLLLMNTISQMTYVGMIMQRIRASACNETWMEIHKTAAALRRSSYSSRGPLLKP